MPLCRLSLHMVQALTSPPCELHVYVCDYVYLSMPVLRLLIMNYCTHDTLKDLVINACYAASQDAQETRKYSTGC